MVHSSSILYSNARSLVPFCLLGLWFLPLVFLLVHFRLPPRPSKVPSLLQGAHKVLSGMRAQAFFGLRELRDNKGLLLALGGPQCRRCRGCVFFKLPFARNFNWILNTTLKAHIAFLGR